MNGLDRILYTRMSGEEIISTLEEERLLRESDIEKYLAKRVVELGGEVRKVKWIGRRGAPDRLVMLPPRVLSNQWEPHIQTEAKTIWVELKAPGKVAEPHQDREHARMRAMGQRVEVIDSIEGVEELLK